MKSSPPKDFITEKDGQLWFIETLDQNRGHFTKVNRVVASTRSNHQQIDVVDTPAFGRMLIIDGDPQSAQADEFIYHETLVHPALVGLSGRQDVAVLVAGSGECASIREVIRYPNVKRVLGIDIDEVMASLVPQHLWPWHQGAIHDPRVELVLDDLVGFLEKCQECFDCVIFDLTSPRPNSPSEKLFNEQFFMKLKLKLKDGGVLSAQAGCLEPGCSATLDMFNMLKKCFEFVNWHGVFIPSFYCVWNFIFCSDDEASIHPDSETIEKCLGNHLESLRYLTPALLKLITSRGPELTPGTTPVFGVDPK